MGWLYVCSCFVFAHMPMDRSSRLIRTRLRLRPVQLSLIDLSLHLDDRVIHSHMPTNVLGLSSLANSLFPTAAHTAKLGAPGTTSLTTPSRSEINGFFSTESIFDGYQGVIGTFGRTTIIVFGMRSSRIRGMSSWCAIFGQGP